MSYPFFPLKVNGEDLDVVVRHWNAVKYGTGVALVVVLYDYLLCLPQEITYIWASSPAIASPEPPESSCRIQQGIANRFRGRRMPWNGGKVLYFFLRYIPLVNIAIHLLAFVHPDLDRSYCIRWFYADSVLSWFLVGAITSLLAIRTAALYTLSPVPPLPTPRSPSVHFNFPAGGFRHRIFPILIYTFAVVVSLSVGILLLAEGRNIDVLIAPKEVRNIFSGCLYTGSTRPIDAVWILLLVFDTVACLATGWKAIAHYKHGTLSHSPLFSTLYTTGFVYFILIFFIALSNITVWFAGGPSLKRMLNVVTRAAMSVGGCRIILELRGVRVGFDSYDLRRTGEHDGDGARSIGLRKFREGDRPPDAGPQQMESLPPATPDGMQQVHPARPVLSLMPQDFEQGPSSSGPSTSKGF